MGFFEGVSAANNTINSDRNERQRILTNKIKGFELDKASGQFEANERGQKMLDLQNEKLNQELMVQKNRNDTISSILNKDSMQEAITHLATGNAHDANRVINANPILKEKLANNYGIHGIMPVDFENDIDLLRDSGIELTPEMRNDKQAMLALKSSLYKTVDNNGKQVIRDVQSTIKTTGYLGYADKYTKEGMINRFNQISQVLSGHLVTEKEQTVKDNKLDNNIKAGEIKGDYLNSILGDDNLTPEQKVYKLTHVEKKKNEIELKQEELGLKVLDSKINQLGMSNNVDSIRKDYIDYISNSDLSPEQKAYKINHVENVKDKTELEELSEQLQIDVLKLKANEIFKDKSFSDLENDYIKMITEDDTLTSAQKLAKLRGTPSESEKLQIELLKSQVKLNKAKAKAKGKTPEEIALIKSQAELNKSKIEDKKSYNEAEFLANLDNPDKIPYNNENLQIAKEIQGSKTNTTALNKSDKKFGIVKATERLIRKFDKLNLDRNAISNLNKALYTITGVGSDANKREMLDKIELDGSLRSVIVEYIKLMSGAAVTDNERKIYTDIISAGDWSNKDAARRSLKTFMESLSSSYNDEIMNMNLPYDKLIRRQKYNDWMQTSVLSSNNDEVKEITKPIIKSEEIDLDLSKYIR